MKLRSAVLAFAIAGFTPTTPAAVMGTPENPRIVGEGITFVPGNKVTIASKNSTDTVITLPDRNIPLPVARPVRKGEQTKTFGENFMASLPQVSCARAANPANTLEEIEKFLCDSTDPKKMTTFRLIDELNAQGLTSSNNFTQFKNAYTRFLNGFNTTSGISDRITRTRDVIGNLYALINTPNTKVSVQWQNRVNWWIKGLNDFQSSQSDIFVAEQPQAQHAYVDNSRQVANNVYANLQNLAYSREYNNLQTILRRNGNYYREDNQQAEVFMKLIKSGYYDNDFKARLNLSVCASYALLNLSHNLGLTGDIGRTAVDSVRRLNYATQGQAAQTDCQRVYYTYR